MAYETGTATSSTDLWNKLLAFLTTNVDLVADGEEWESVWTHPDGATSGTVLRGPGSGGTDSVYVSMSLTTTTGTDDHRIQFRGMSQVNPSAIAVTEHINVSPGVRIWLDAGAMKYWFVASGRRFMIVVNMSTVYEVAYCGLFLPYALPNEYPYPLFIGASSSASTEVTSWRSTVDAHAAFPFSPYSGSGLNRASGYVLAPTGAWLNAPSQNVSAAQACLGPYRYQEYDVDGGNRFMLSTNGTGVVPGYESIRSRQMMSYDSIFFVEPITIIQTNNAMQMMGVLDNFFVCPGVGNAAENTIEIDGVDHLVVQNIFRSTTSTYMAIRLE